MAFDHKSFLQNLTTQAGVYRMLGKAGEILYVGKANNLKKRVSSYFNRAHNERLTKLVSRIDSIEISVTANDREALLLENSLIKELKPKYNIILKDDKSYPYLFLSEHSYPALRYHRGKQGKPGEYFGPFTSIYSVRESLEVLQQIFKLRSCEEHFFNNRSRPCLQYQIKRCSAPCVALVSEQDYANDVRAAKLFLQGKNDKLIAELGERMQHASLAQEYEKASAVRDKIIALRHIRQSQAVVGQGKDTDVVTIYREGGLCVVYLLPIRLGKVLVGKTYFIVEHAFADHELLRSFIEQYYLNIPNKDDVPKEIVLGADIPEKEQFAGVLKEVMHKSIKLISSPKEEKLNWLRIANDSAKQSIQTRLTAKQLHNSRADELAKLLALGKDKFYMECFDISHTQGEQTVASCVVFTENGPLKEKYRIYKLDKGLHGDDYAAMREVLTRRFVKKDTPLPDILLIDGGKGQFSIAKEVLQSRREKGYPTNCLMIAIAKGKERKAGLETLFVAHDNLAQGSPLLEGEQALVRQLQDDTKYLIVNLAKETKALHFIQHIRDESHRFAIRHHRKLRAKSRQRSSLEGIKGVGSKRRQALLAHFGGLSELGKASLEDISKVSGISLETAQNIYYFLHGE